MNSGSREYDSLLLIAVAPSLRNLSIDTGGMFCLSIAPLYMQLNPCSGLHDAIDFPHIPLVRTFEITTFVDYPRCLPAKFQNTFAKIVIAFPDIEILNLTFRFDLVYPEIPWQTEGTSLCWVHRSRRVHSLCIFGRCIARLFRGGESLTATPSYDISATRWISGCRVSRLT
jgi:hypothetical protein